MTGSVLLTVVYFSSMNYRQVEIIMHPVSMKSLKVMTNITLMDLIKMVGVKSKKP